MPLDDSTWVIHSLPRARRDGPDPAQEVPLHAFRSVLSPWRDREGPVQRADLRPEAGGPRGPVRAAG